MKHGLRLMGLAGGLVLMTGLMAVDARDAAFMALPTVQPVVPQPSPLPVPPSAIPVPTVAENPPPDVVLPTPVVDKLPSIPVQVAVPSVSQIPSVLPPLTTGIQVVIESPVELDAGVTSASHIKHVTIPFSNHGNVAVPVDKIAITAQNHVSYAIVHDTCSRQTLRMATECSVDLDIVPHTNGEWSLDVALLPFASGPAAHTHIISQHRPGAGEPVKPLVAHLDVQQQDDGKGLRLQNMSMIDFGETYVGGGKLVRSALVINDGQMPAVLQSIEVVAADIGFTHVDHGCVVGMRLNSGESCPVVLVWAPQKATQLSTDLIIRYSTHPGFMVVSVRGMAHQETVASETSPSPNQLLPVIRSKSAATGTTPHTSPLSARKDHSLVVITPDIKKIISILPDTAVGRIPRRHAVEEISGIQLIGIVGKRAILRKSSQITVVVSAGDPVDLGKKSARIMDVHPQSVDILFENKTVTLKLEPNEEHSLKSSSLIFSPVREDMTSQNGTSRAAAAGFLGVLPLETGGP